MRKFDDIYEVIYNENADSMEKLRKKTRNAALIVFFISLVLGIILSIIIENAGFLVLCIIIPCIYIGFSKSRKNYQSEFKQKIIKSFVKEYSETLDFIPEQGISSSAYNEGEFERYDRYRTEDLIIGTLEDGYKIVMAEVLTEDETTDSDGDTTYTTLFHGLFAKVEIDKIVNSNIKIRKNGISLFKSKEKIEMDSGEFEKKFNVYATDKIIAMQLLTADIMQMFLDFKTNNKITPELTIKQSNLYIRFATGGMFEGSILKKSMNYDTLKKYYDTINFTLDITEKILKNIKETEI